MIINLTNPSAIDYGKEQSLTSQEQAQARTNIGYRDLKSFGAIGDGVTDDSNAVRLALEWWGANDGNTLNIENGTYIIGSPVRVLFSNSQNMGKIQGRGGVLRPTFTGTNGTGTIAIENNVIAGVGTNFTTELQIGDHVLVGTEEYTVYAVNSNAEALICQHTITAASVPSGTSYQIWKPGICLQANGYLARPEFNGLRFTAPPTVNHGSLFTIVGAGPAQSWGGLVVDQLKCYSYNTCFEVGPSVWESNFNNLELQSKDNGNCDTLRVLQGTSGDVSSVFFNNPNIRGGLHGIVSNVNDIYVNGGTAILAAKEGALFTKFNGALSDFHFENNWQSLAPADGQAGGYIIANRCCSISGVGGLRDTSSGQKHILRLYTSYQPIAIVGGWNASAQAGDTYAYCQTTGTGSILMPDLSSTDVYGSNINKYGVRMVTSLSNQKVVYMSYASSITPNIYTGSFFDIAITGAMTINEPTGITPLSGDEITFLFRSESTGGYAITFNSVFSLSASVSTTINKKTILKFQYGSDHKWSETSRSIC